MVPGSEWPPPQSMVCVTCIYFAVMMILLVLTCILTCTLTCVICPHSVMIIFLVLSGISSRFSANNKAYCGFSLSATTPFFHCRIVGQQFRPLM